MTNFHGRLLPEDGRPAGYAALIEKYHLPVALPKQLTAIAERHSKTATEDWQMLTPRHWPGNTLSNHLRFALKWETTVHVGEGGADFAAESDQQSARNR